MMIETCIDISNHIISDEGMKVPISYVDTFKILFDNNMIDSDLFNTMEKMTKFRNIIVHQYEEVDAEIVVLISAYLNHKRANIVKIFGYIQDGSNDDRVLK